MNLREPVGPEGMLAALRRSARRGSPWGASWAVGAALLGAVACAAAPARLSPAGEERAHAGEEREDEEARARQTEDVEVAREEPTQSSPAAREAWRAAAQANDWQEVASRIDTLPERDRADPGTRYVRALAARQLGDCEGALTALDGLSESLPLLAAEVDDMRAECQLAVGPFDATASALMNRVSLEGRLEAARSWQRAGQLERAQHIVEGILEQASEGSTKRAEREVYVQARGLRAELAQQRGELELALGDLRWLAIVAAAPEADATFERLARTRLTKAERAERVERLAERGEVRLVERELQLLAKAPGAEPRRATLLRALAFAHYRARDDYGRAAKLFEQVAALEGRGRATDLFKAASAWYRAKRMDRALAVYDRIIRQFPNSRAAEQAMHSKAHAFYSSGRFGEAAAAYGKYLGRYERGKRARRARFVQQSRYERAVSQLALGDYRAARAGFEQVRRMRGSRYSRSMLDHLDAVALATSGVARLENEAVERFEQVVREHPLSFAALLSGARLENMGRRPPALAPLPVAVDPADWPELPEKARLLADLGLNSAAERTLHEEEPALRELYSPRASETLCRQYESLDRGWRRYSLATGSVGYGILQRAPTASNLWAWHCLYPRPYAATIGRLERQHGVAPGLIHAVMRQESAFRPEARSHVGAVGLMQLMPTTAERAARELMLEHESGRLTQAEYNLELGAFYLGKLLGTFDGRVALAVSSYNAGPHAVFSWLGGRKSLPLDIWAARIPYTETRNYVDRVLSNWARYRYLEGGPESVPKLALRLPKGLKLPNDAY